MSDNSLLSASTPVCLIGASAGGVAALQRFFRAIRIDLGLAYVVVMHLAADQPSVLDEVLSAVTAMPVDRVTKPTWLAPNTVYVISPKQELLIENGRLTSRKLAKATHARSPIDTLFCSFAHDRSDGIAIIMTGAGHDGTGGARAIKEAGGFVCVQDPQDAEYPSMPQSAVETGLADFVEPVERLAKRVQELCTANGGFALEANQKQIDRVIALMRVRTGHDFSKYKQTTIIRRIGRRAQLRKRLSLADYADYVRDNPVESQFLFKELLISVTAFFRDAQAFAALQQTAIRSIIASGAKEVRVWTVGCATGEEAYSLAMLLLEEAAQQEHQIAIQVFATDLDEDALDRARAGIYSRSIEADVSEARLQRFFIDEGTRYRVRPELRDVILFAAHSITRDPPFTRIDLISCRNVLIYFERKLQQQVSVLLRYGLKAGGYLFLGPAESPDIASRQFETVDREARIFRAQPQAALIVPPLMARRSMPDLEPGTARPQPSLHTDAGDLQSRLSHLDALEEYTPPSVVVDVEQRVLHLSPSAGRFMRLPGGLLTESLPSLVKPELRGEILIALNQVIETSKPVLTGPVTVEIDRERRAVRLYVSLLATDATKRALIWFLDGGSTGRETDDPASPQIEEIRRLQAELGAAQQLAVASRNEHQIVLQDLRAPMKSCNP